MSLSIPAKKCISKIDKVIMGCEEILDHDGYDEYGSKSDLWDLFILYKETDKYLVDWYHWENWFEKDIVKEYVLLKTYNLDEIKNDIIRTSIEDKIIKLFDNLTN